jgi:hypothetical protein
MAQIKQAGARRPHDFGFNAIDAFDCRMQRRSTVVIL